MSFFTSYPHVVQTPTSGHPSLLSFSLSPLSTHPPPRFKSAKHKNFSLHNTGPARNCGANRVNYEFALSNDDQTNANWRTSPACRRKLPAAAVVWWVKRTDWVCCAWLSLLPLSNSIICTYCRSSVAGRKLSTLREECVCGEWVREVFVVVHVMTRDCFRFQRGVWEWEDFVAAVIGALVHIRGGWFSLPL